MKIHITGLGLIGGSLAQALLARTTHEIFGFDLDPKISADASADGVKFLPLDSPAENFSQIDCALIALYPRDILTGVETLAKKLSPKKIIVDLCGVKSAIVETAAKICAERDVQFIGGHPMAGREISGYAAARATLFDQAAMLLCPPRVCDRKIFSQVVALFTEIGFRQVVETSPEKHDEIIAFTSQLPHVLSSAYAASAQNFPALDGAFTAGSFRDFLRVASLNIPMWDELFRANRPALIKVISTFQEFLREYHDALIAAETDHGEKLRALMQAGNDSHAKIRQTFNPTSASREQ